MKTVAAILFAFFMVWQPMTARPEKAGCCGPPEIACAGCCCFESAPIESKPVTPVQTRSAATEQMTLLRPTVSGVVLDKKFLSSVDSDAAPSLAAGVVPLFRRDCAILI